MAALKSIDLRGMSIGVLLNTASGSCGLGPSMKWNRSFRLQDLHLTNSGVAVEKKSDAR